MNHKIKKILTISILIGLSSIGINAHAQKGIDKLLNLNQNNSNEASIQENKNKNIYDNKIYPYSSLNPFLNLRSELSEEDKNSYFLDGLLNYQEYLKFEHHYTDILKTDKEQREYLFGKIKEGHPIVFWLLATHYSRDIVNSKYEFTNKKTIDFTQQMYYIALILTQQDIGMCQDQTARNATAEILKRFPILYDFQLKNYTNNKEIFLKSMDYVNNMKVRQDPDWVCVLYGTPGTMKYGEIYTDREKNNIIKDINVKLLEKFAK